MSKTAKYAAVIKTVDNFTSIFNMEVCYTLSGTMQLNSHIQCNHAHCSHIYPAAMYSAVMYTAVMYIDVICIAVEYMAVT